MNLNERGTPNWIHESIHFLMTLGAVFLAVFAEGWLQERELRNLAVRARGAVETELEKNARQFSESFPYIHELRCRLEGIVKAKGNVEPAIWRELPAFFPDVSTTDWQAAQISAAGRYTGYQWMQPIAPAYELYEDYAQSKQDFFEHFARLNAWRIEHSEGPFETGELALLARPVYGYMRILESLHQQVQARLTGGGNEPIRLGPCPVRCPAGC